MKTDCINFSIHSRPVTVRLSLALFLMLVPLCLAAQRPEFNGQVSAFELLRLSDPLQSVTGLRYVPELKWKTAVGKSWTADLEASANLFGQLNFLPADSLSTDFSLRPYRIWGRLASERFELRLGLQKISFGSAVMLRPLMWFDLMDPRDPLQLTDGVYAALGRYFFQNNANVWLWAILPGERLKGWEVFLTDRKTPEFGGRFQIPAGQGEIALTSHFRYIGTLQFPPPITSPKPEYKVGLDGKWDIGPGIWFEGSFSWSDLPIAALRQQGMLTLGADYTFGLGNGLTAMTEHFIYRSGNTLFRDDAQMAFTAFSLTYPFSLTHTLTTMVFYRWDNAEWYRFVNWTMNLKRVRLHLIAFWNPDQFNLYQNRLNSNLMAGKGLQMLLVWNH